MKVATRQRKTETAQAAAEMMAKRGFNPIERMMDMVDGEVPVPDTGDSECDKATLRSMLCTDYEPGPTTGMLRIRSRLRADLLMELARYAHPRLKATDEAAGSAAAGLTVEIKNYPSAQASPAQPAGRLGIG